MNSSQEKVSAASKDPLPHFALDTKTLQDDLNELTRSPHPFGSRRQGEIIDWLEARIKKLGAKPVRQTFVANVPNSDLLANPQRPAPMTLSRSGTNLYALDVVHGNAPCVVALATHFDTKDLSQGMPSFREKKDISVREDKGYLGANDSASSTAALLGQLAFLRHNGPQLGLTCDIIGIFFDGEEAVLPNWTDGTILHPARIEDHTYGSRFAAAALHDCLWNGMQTKCLPRELGGRPLVALVLMDMIGSPDLVISRDIASSKKLWDIFEKAASSLGMSHRLAERPQMIEDDHIPFIQKGVQSLDIIDFEHLETWHVTSDILANISHQSIDLGAKLALVTAVLVGQKPQVF